MLDAVRRVPRAAGRRAATSASTPSSMLRDRLAAAGLAAGAARTGPTPCTPPTGGSSAWSARPTTPTRWSRPTTGSWCGTSPRRPAITRITEQAPQPGARQERRGVLPQARGARRGTGPPHRPEGRPCLRLRCTSTTWRASSPRPSCGPPSTRSRNGSCRLRDDPVVPGRPRRHLEPHRGAHGAHARRPPRRRRSGASTGCRRSSATTAPGTSTTWPTGSSRTSWTPTASPTWPPASGTTGSSTGTGAALEAMWPMVGRRDRVRPGPADAAGRDPLGPPRRRHAVELRPADRVLVHLPQPALRHRDRRRSSATSAPTGSCRRPG